MSRQRIRSLLLRIRSLEHRDTGVTSWLARRRALDDSLLQKLMDLTFEPMTDERIGRLAKEAREGFEARKTALQSGPTAALYAHLMKFAGEPDPRRFATADEYAAAKEAWHRSMRDEEASAGQAGRTEPAAGGGALE
jgi:hypothetical protein